LAIEALRKVVEIEPKFGQAHIKLGFSYAHAGMPQEALHEMERTRELMGDNIETLICRGYVYAVVGKADEARGILREVLALASREGIKPYRVADIYAALGDREQAFAWLEKAYEARMVENEWLKVTPQMDNLRGDPRYTQLLRRVGLAD